MYFLTPMCFICLQSKSDLIVSSTETLTKLIYCIEKIDYFIPYLSNQTKICNDCLNKLNMTFDFKKLCLNNINQFKDYIRQLDNFNPYKIITVVLTDVNELKITLEDNKFGKQIETVFIKEEVCNNIYFKSHQSDEVYLDEEVKLLSQTEEILQDEKQMQPIKMYRDESPDLHLEQLLDEQVGNTIVKCEILETTAEKQYSNEEFKLFEHKAEILADDCDELEIVPFLSNSYCCYKCQKCFKFKSTLKKHVLVHINGRRHSCSICNKGFISKSNLKQHILNHTNELPQSYLISTKSALKRRMLEHTNERPHCCSICKKDFKYKCHLKRHMFIHTNERPHSCSICRKSFTRKCTLTRHTLVHTGEKPHSCSICKKNFRLKNSLNLHMILHTSERPHTCSICNKGFIYKNDLKRHAIIHTNERPYSCSVCNKSFNQKVSLNFHMLVHTKERPHSCPVCGKAFSRKADLKEHMFVHKNERPHSCSVCKKGFIKKSYLNKHLLSHTNKSFI